MYVYELNEDLGLLVGRRMAGPHAAFAPQMIAAQRLLTACTERSPVTALNVLLVDPDVEPPDAPLRQTYAKESSVSSGLFVIVSSSMKARAAALAIAAMKGETGAQHGAFSDFDRALEWIDARRPGVRFKLGAMRAKVMLQKPQVRAAR